MEKIIVIDGYNFIQRTPRFKVELDESLEAARNALIAAVRGYRRVKRTFDRAIVVFDSRQETVCPDSLGYYEAAVRVIFSRPDKQADDVIASIIRENSKTSRITVVSDDNYVINKSRSYSCDIMSCRDFLEQLYPRQARNTHTRREKDLSGEDMEDINRHLRKAWNIK